MFTSLYKQILKAVTLLGIGFTTFPSLLMAQENSIVNLLYISASDLNSSQAARYEQVLADASLKNHRFIHFSSLSSSQSDGWIKLDLQDYLPCRNTLMHINFMQFFSDDSFRSEYVIESDSFGGCDEGYIMLTKSWGNYSGILEMGGLTFKITDVGGGIQIISELQGLPEPNNGFTCGDEGGPGFIDSTTEPCVRNKTRLMVLYTSSALRNHPDIKSIAEASYTDLLVCMYNSQISEDVEWVGVFPTTFQENPWVNSAERDLELIAIDPDVNTKRDLYNADIVVVLTTDWLYPYGGRQNLVPGWTHIVDGDKTGAYHVVAANYAYSPNHVFAHEVIHIFGGRHLDINENPFTAQPRWARAWQFLGQPNIMSSADERSTLMVSGVKAQIQYISNPNVKYKGKATGKANEADNARRVNIKKYTLRGFYSDYVPFWAEMDAPEMVDCYLGGTATAQPFCGTSPYQYHWWTSSDGIHWTLSTSNINTLPFNVPAPRTGIHSTRLFIRVTVTDTVGHSYTVDRYANTWCGSNPWNNGPPFVKNNGPKMNNIIAVNYSKENETLRIITKNDSISFKFVIYNMAGQKISEEATFGLPNVRGLHLSSGLYVLEFRNSQATHVERTKLYVP